MMEAGKNDVGTRDQLHDQQLLRDMAIINARTREELGMLPLNGVPVIAKRVCRISKECMLIGIEMVRPGVRLTPAEALEVSRALGVRADLERGELRVYLGGEGSPACAGARACAEVLRDLGLVCAVGSWGLD